MPVFILPTAIMAKVNKRNETDAGKDERKSTWSLLVGVQTCSTFTGISVEVSKKLEMDLPHEPATPLGHTHILLQRHLPIHVHCCCIHNNQKLNSLDPATEECIKGIFFTMEFYFGCQEKSDSEVYK